MNKVEETLESWSYLEDFNELVTVVEDLIANELADFSAEHVKAILETGVDNTNYNGGGKKK